MPKSHTCYTYRMIQFNPYLNFAGTTREAFEFYQSVFGGEIVDVTRFRDMSEMGDGIPEAEMDGMMHIALKVGNITLRGTDITSNMNEPAVLGNMVTIQVDPGSREETDRIFAALSEGGEVHYALYDAEWGDYFGICQDKFGMRWMLNHEPKR